jgi:hypothetical protein
VVACDSAPSGPEAGREVAVVELTPGEMQLEVGDTLRVQAMPFDEDGEPIFGREVRWVVGHTSVIEVSSTGLVKAKTEGNTWVRAIVGDVLATAMVAVVDPNAPAPVITAIEPSSVEAGSSAFTLVVRGQNFGAGSDLLWGGDLLGTTRIGETELRAQIPADRIADAGTAEIRVRRYGSQSEPATLTIEPAGGGGGSAPPLGGLSPATVPAGSDAFTLKVVGTGFPEAAGVLWNGTALDTHWGGPTELFVRIYPVAVWHPGPVQIRVTYGDGPQAPVSPPFAFVVGPTDVQTIDVSPTSLELDPGGAETLTVRLLNAAGMEVTDRYVSFHSANALIAEVLGDGEVRALREGSTKIRVSNSERFVEIPVSVGSAPVSRVEVWPGQAVVTTRSTVQLEARTYVGTGEEVTNREVVWWSADPSVAIVGTDGLVAGRSRGEVWIWAESEGVRSWAAVEVRELPTTPEWTFDLRWDLSTLPPAVGDTTWVEGGVTHHGTFYLSEASMTLDHDSARWRQRMVWHLWEGPSLVDEVVREQEGTIGLYVPGPGYAFVSDGPVAVTVATGHVNDLGELRLRQAVGTAPAADYLYVVR